MKNKKIIIIGAGAWGTAISELLAHNNNQILLIANNLQIVKEINDLHQNSKFLAEIQLNPNIIASNDLHECQDADIIFIATPSNATSALFNELAELDLKKDCALVVCSKGLDQQSLKFFHQILEENFASSQYAFVSGPNFAMEVAQKLPTITTIASKNLDLAENIAKIMQNQYFKTQITNDVVVTEICGIIKNIMAIGCGIIDGFNLGQNAKARLLCQGIKEIEILCQKFNSTAAINNAAGFGDIFLTCASTKSRNNFLGSEIAKGKKYKDLANSKTFEGAISAIAIDNLAKKMALNLSLCTIISDILQNDYDLKTIKNKIIAAI